MSSPPRYATSGSFIACLTKMRRGAAEASRMGPDSPADCLYGPVKAKLHALTIMS